MISDNTTMKYISQHFGTSNEVWAQNIMYNSIEPPLLGYTTVRGITPVVTKWLPTEKIYPTPKRGIKVKSDSKIHM